MRPAIVALAFCLAVAQVYSAPTEDTSSTTAPAANASVPDGANLVAAHAHLANSTFTCYNRQVGYYADPDSDCKVYHFCMLGEYNGQEVYQRVSYMCLNDTVFDQRALDCVESAKATTQCKDSASIYDESNAILRKAIIGKLNADEAKEGESKPDEHKADDKKDEDKKDEDKKESDKKDEDKAADEKSDDKDKHEKKKDEKSDD